MKKSIQIFILVLFIIKTSDVNAQSTLENYFIAKGVNSVCQAAHATNDYLSGTYDINNGYVDISLKSKDNVFGAIIRTDIRILKGSGGLYFSDLIVQNDDDMVSPFEAFGLESSILVSFMKMIDEDSYSKVRNGMIQKFGTDFEKWNGKTWALLVLNLDYYNYILTGK